MSDQNGSKGGRHENEFRLFSNTRMMLQTFRVEKVDETSTAAVDPRHLKVEVTKIFLIVPMLQIEFANI